LIRFAAIRFYRWAVPRVESEPTHSVCRREVPMCLERIRWPRRAPGGHWARSYLGSCGGRVLHGWPGTGAVPDEVLCVRRGASVVEMVL